MSHFAVAVFQRGIPTDDSLNELLEPFWEGDGAQDEDNPFFVFEDMTDEYKAQYEKETVTRIKCPDGELVPPWDERFRIPDIVEIGKVTHKVPDEPGYEEVEVPFEELYPSFEAFAEDWHGHPVNENGRCGYWHNPNARWDWYQVGGRWSGMLKVKEGCDGYTYLARCFGSDEGKAGWVDCCPVSCIDFDGMRKDALKELKPYEEYVTKHTFYKEEYLRAKYPTEEEYIRRMTGFGTYAVITPEGEWLSSGQMGWFGCSSETTEELRSWEEQYHKFFEMFADCYVTIVDCHI